ncbi:hypothetical protein NX722_28405 [Endozoicomonas gorgoniicola]|uniref:Uncharacterized protein n=1 Tax=Endozoicomonas gorgoniicola TaxID=1234144 RepID=A0ABT3N4D0_9GAMM|nr:DUF6682 family protein [Endozoicomonas gorgoniicola]MCW7556489.1 hypothetical protein [Endozoicomonas gorgoniicola]
MRVRAILDSVRGTLQDNQPPNFNPATDVWTALWSDDKLLDGYNRARLWHVQQRPDTYAVTVSFNCKAESEQTVPAEAYRLLGVLENTATGRVVNPTTREDLTAMIPNWYNDSGSEVELYFTDERTPRSFWVYPKPPANHEVRLQVSRIPALVSMNEVDHSSNPAELDLPLVHLPSIENYMLFHAYMQDIETESNLIQAQNYIKLAANDLGVSWNIDLVFSQPVKGDANG